MLRDLIFENPVLLLFLVLAIGFVIGNIKFGSFQLGSVAGVLLAGLVLGNFGFKSSPEIQSFGFVLFMFSVGYSAGPRFIQALKKDGRRYLSIAIIVSVSGFALVKVMSGVLNFEPGIAAGLMAGALTSTPTLAAADDAALNADPAIFGGLAIEEVRTNINTAYAITYIFGLVGLILVIRILPGLLKINLVDEAIKLEKEDASSGGQPIFSPSDIIVRAFEVTNSNYIGIPLKEFYDRAKIQFTIQKLKRKGELIDLSLETELEIGDHISIVGVMDQRSIDQLSNDVLGPGVRDTELLQFDPESLRIVITHKTASGTILGDLATPVHYGSFVSRIVRVGVDIEVSATTELQRGDVLHVMGPSGGLEALGNKLGHIERTVEETDLSTFSWAIVFGMLVGALAISIGGVNIGLGSAGGLLVAGLTIGYLRSLWPVFGRVPDGARWVFTEMGLLIFMAGVGLRGGAGLIETLQESGLALLGAGILVTLVPLFIAYFYGSKVLKMNPLMLLGAIVGAMTSGGALSVINDQSKSSIASIGYTGAYAFANILLTIAGALMILL
jgi:putative transport protein